MRLFIVGMSMLIAGPSLSRLFEEHAILDAMRLENAKRAAVLIRDLRKEAGVQRQQLEDDRRNTERDYQKELIGGNGKRGDGPIAKALLVRIHATDEKIGALERATEQKAQYIKQASPEDLVREFGVPLLVDNPDTRASLRSEFERQNKTDRILGVPSSKVMASALMALLFASMLCLKIAAPASCKVYFSQYLQELYRHYKDGALDGLPQNILPVEVRASGGRLMGPTQWSAWVFETYLPQSRAIARDSAQGAAHDRVRLGIGRIQSRCAQAEQAIQRDSAQRSRFASESEELQGALLSDERNARSIDLAIEDSVRAPLRSRQAALEHERSQLQTEKATNLGTIETALNPEITDACTLIDRQVHALGLTTDQVTPKIIDDDAHLSGQFARRKALIENKNALKKRNLDIDFALVELDERLRQLEAEVERSIDPGAHGLGSITEAQRDLHERRMHVAESLQRRIIRRREIDASIAELDRRIAQTRETLVADRAELTHLWAQLRALERRIDTGGVDT